MSFNDSICHCEELQATRQSRRLYGILKQEIALLRSQ